MRANSIGADASSPPPLSLLSPPKTKPPTGGKGTGAMGGKAGTAEQLVLLIAQQVGVPPEAIKRLPPAALPPT
jgi:hypothetical protein